MEVKTALSQAEMLKLKGTVDAFNKTVNEGRVTKKELGKDDFLKILITQLTHQDPTKPLEDREFIAQMAQFSTLEQMTQMNMEMSKINQTVNGNQSLGLLGRTVTIGSGEEMISGTVEKIRGGEIFVNGKYYDASSVDSISNK